MVRKENLPNNSVFGKVLSEIYALKVLQKRPKWARPPHKQDAREAMRVVFSVLTKRICMHKTNFLRIYSNIVLKVILICKLQLS